MKKGYVVSMFLRNTVLFFMFISGVIVVSSHDDSVSDGIVDRSGEEFFATTGGSVVDWLESVKATPDGGCIAVGYTDSYGEGEPDVLVLKFAANGTLDWARTAGDSSWDWAFDVDLTLDDGYVVAGFSESYSNGTADVLILKYTDDGTLSWARTAGGADQDFAYSVDCIADGSFIVAGMTQSYGAGSQDVFLLKVTSEGALSWARTIGGISYDYANSVVEASGEQFLVAGRTLSYGTGNMSMFLLNCTSAGVVNWTRVAGGSNDEEAMALAVLSDGSILSTGYTSSFGEGGNDMILLKYTSAGSLSWAKTYGGTLYDRAFRIRKTSDGGAVICGISESCSGEGDALLCKISSNGSLSWTRYLGSDDSDWGSTVDVATDGGYFVAGHTYSFGNFVQAFTVKSNSAGHVSNCPYVNDCTLTKNDVTVTENQVTLASVLQTITYATVSPTVHNITPDHTQECAFLPTPTPLPPDGDTCDDVIELEAMDCYCGSTTGKVNDYDPSGINTFNGPDMVFKFTVSNRERVHIIGEANFDADWAIASVCDASTADYLEQNYYGVHNDPSCSLIEPHVTNSVLNYNFDPPAGEYYLWVDGYGSASGDFCFEIQIYPIPQGEDCGDPIPMPDGGCYCGTISSDASIQTDFIRKNWDCIGGSVLFDGPDAVFMISVPSRSRVHLIGEANYDADWAVTSVCGSNSGDYLCTDYTGPHDDPYCSMIDQNPIHSDVNYIFDPPEGDYYIWVDGMGTSSGDFCLEVQIYPIAQGEDCADPIPLAGNDCYCGTTLVNIRDEGACIRNNWDCIGNVLFNSNDAVMMISVPDSTRVHLIGEADYDADWAVTSICDSSSGCYLCTNNTGAHDDPYCSLINTNPNFSDLNFTFDPPEGDYYIWVDGMGNATGNFCLEVISYPIGDPSPTPQPTWTPVPTVTPTVTPQPGTLTGFVDLESRPAPPHNNWITDLEITLCINGNPIETFTTQTDESGNFSVAVWSGEYDILVKGSHTLANRLDDVVIPLGGSVGPLDFGLLAEGDANNDNNVTSTDFFILRDAYNTSEGDPNFDPRTDFNNDGNIISSDFFILRNHYNVAGDTCNQ